MPGRTLYEFGPYRLDVALSRLERAGTAVPLPPKAFDLLLLLARNPDRVMGKSELIEALWPHTFVDEANLTQHVYTLRKALGDQAEGRPYIETVARRGYRLASVVATTMTSGVATAAPAVADAERRHATVLHCAMSNASAIIERFGLAELRTMMARLLAIATTEIEPYGGVITDRHPDGFVAMFGAAVVHEDDGRRAVLAALAIRHRAPAVMGAAAPDEEPFELRIGIDTGPLVITPIVGDRGVECTAVGETLRKADLLRQLARPGDILVSETTRQVVDRFVTLEPMAIPSSAGAAYRVLGAMRRSSIAPPSTHALAPYVGRQQEIAALEWLLASAVAGQGQVVSIVAEPGMGKSRLVYEFARQLENRAEPPAILEGRCVSYGSLVPYLPLVDLVRACCGADDADSPEAIRGAVERTVREHSLPADAGGWLLRLLGIVHSAAPLDPVTPEAVKARTFDALRLLLMKAATRRPLVIVVEDLHWIDRTSEEFLTTLVAGLVGSRVLLIATHRPGCRIPWIDRSYATQITLAPLGAADSAELVRSVVQQPFLDPEVAHAIMSRGEGNPFFLEELARTVVEHGPGTQAIPETVHGVIMARIDRLPAVAKLVVQTASVLGREVPGALLRAAWAGPENLNAGLAELCRLEFLFERPAGDEPSYVFKHALTQDVAYDSLLTRNRRDVHLRAARALETLHGERANDVAATLAYHYARTDMVEESVTWLTRAADRAARVYANTEAMLHLDLAARRVQRLPEGPARDRWMVQVAQQQAHSLYFLGRWRESVDALLPHEARVTRLNDAVITAGCAFWLAHMYTRLGDQRRASECAWRAIDAATSAGDDATLGKAHGVLALDSHWAGTPADGIAHGERAVALLAPQPDQRWWLGMAYFYLALNHILRGDFERALADAARADEVGAGIGDPRLRTYAGFGVAWIETLRGNHEAALARAKRSLELAPDRVSRVYASLFLAHARLEQGEHEEARARLALLVGEFESFGFVQWQAFAAALVGESLRRLGRLDEADTAVQCASSIATRAAYWYAVALSDRIAGRIAHDRGRAADAAQAFGRALETFTRIGAAFECGRTRAELEAAVAVQQSDGHPGQ